MGCLVFSSWKKHDVGICERNLDSHISRLFFMIFWNFLSGLLFEILFQNSYLKCFFKILFSRFFFKIRFVFQDSFLQKSFCKILENTEENKTKTTKLTFRTLLKQPRGQKSNQVKTIWPYLRILCGCKGRSSGPTSTSWSLIKLYMVSPTTFPNRVCLFCNSWVGPMVKKNWLELSSFPALAMATRPRLINLSLVWTSSLKGAP